MTQEHTRQYKTVSETTLRQTLLKQLQQHILLFLTLNILFKQNRDISDINLLNTLI